MDINQVIELGQQAANIDYKIFVFPWWWYLVSVILLLLLIAQIALMDEESFIFSIIFMLWFLGSMAYVAFINAEIETKQINKWKTEVAYPYINSLPIEKKEIVFIKIDPELSHDTKGSLFYTYSTPIQLTPLVISYIDDGGVVTITRWTETKMELTDKEKPYIEFQELKKDLGNGVDKGLYNVKVYLPRSYKFTDIK
jgi:hypothetical protein